jgi:site-specific DNA recombinase
MTTTPAPTRAVIYARISKDPDGKAVGVERQVESCTHLAQAREWDLVAPPLIDNDISAYSGAHRPAYEQMMAMIAGRQVDAVLTWDMDRMCCRVADLVDITRACLATGAKIASVHGDYDLSTPVGRMFATILIAVAEYERAHKGERHQAANEQAAKNGERRTGTPRPFGYQPDHVTPEPAEADAIQWAAACLLGGGTVSSVMREWDSRGLVTPQGGKAFTRNSVTTILRNPALAGLRAYRGEIVADGTWEPVLPRATWEAVRGLLEDPSRKPPRGVRTLLGGLALCRCGNAVIGGQRNGKYRIYRCNPETRNDRPGPHLGGMRAAPVDEFVTAVIVGRLARPDLADLITPPPSVDAGALRTEAEGIRRNLEQMAADAVLAGYSRAMLTAATERANARLKQISASLASSAQSSALAPFLAGERAQVVWDRLDLARQRAVIRFLVNVTIHPAGRGARTFNPDTVQITPAAE